MNKECKYYLPHNLDLRVLEKEYPPSFVYSTDKAMYILTLINTIPANNRSKYANSEGWTPINSTTIQNVSIRNKYGHLYRYYTNCCQLKDREK